MADSTAECWRRRRIKSGAASRSRWASESLPFLGSTTCGISLKDRYRIAYWDAAIVAAARILGAGTLYSEDLNHGQDYDGVRVVNPFLPH